MACARLHFPSKTGSSRSLSFFFSLLASVCFLPKPSNKHSCTGGSIETTSSRAFAHPSFPQQQRQPPTTKKKKLKVDAEKSRLASSISTTPVYSTQLVPPTATRHQPTKPASYTAPLPSFFLAFCPDPPRQRRGTRSSRCSRGAPQLDSSNSTFHPVPGLLQASHLQSQ